MIVTCTNCGIHYNLDERLVNPDGSKVRCDACETVFTVGKDGAWPVRDEMADSALPAVSDEEDTGDGSPGFWMSAAGEVLVAPPGLRLLDEPTELSMGLGPEPLPLGRQMGLGEDLGVEPGSLWREPEESIGDDREAVEIDQALRGLGKDLQDGEESGQEPGDELEYTEVEGPEPVEKALEHLGENLETLGTGRVAMEVSDSSRYPETYGDDSGEETEIDAGGEPVDDALRELAHDLGSHDAEPAGGDGLAEEEPRTGLEGDSSQASDSEGWGGAVEEESPETGGPEVDEALEHLGEDLESLGRQETGPYEYATGGPSWPDSGETDEETKAADHVYADAESVGRINAELDDPEMFEDLGQDVNMEGKPAARVLEEEYASEPRNMDVATEGLDEGALDVEADLDLGAGPPGYSPREDSEGTSDDLEDVSLDLEEWDESEEPARRGEPGPQEGPGGVNAVGDALETAEEEEFPEEELEEEGPGPMDDLGMPDLGATAEEIESLDASEYGETGHEQTEAGTVDEFEEVEDISEDLEDVEDISDALEAVEEEFPEEEPVEFLEETVEVVEEFEETEAGDEAGPFAGPVDEAAEDLFTGDEDFGAVDEFEEVEDISEDLEDVEDISDALEAVEEEFPEEEPVEFLEETVEVVEEFEETEAGDEAGPFADAVDEAAEDLFAGDEDFAEVDEFEEEGPGPMDDLGMPDLGATAEEIESLDVSEILEDVEDISGDMEAVEEEFSEEEPIEFLEEVEETEADDEADRFARDELPDYEALEPEEPPEDLEEITEGVEELVDFADLTEKPESPGFADDEGVEAGFGQEDFPDDIGLALEEGTIEEPPDLPEYPLSDDEGLEEALLSGAFEVEGAPSPEGPEAEEVEEEFEGLDVDLAALEEDGTTDQEEKEEAEESPSEQIVGEEAALEEAEFDLGLPLLDEEAEEEPAVEVGEETADEAFDLGLPDLDDGLLEEEAEEEEEATGLGFLTDAEGLDEDMDLGLPDAEGDLMAPEPEASEAFADLGIDLTLPDVDEEEEEGLPFEPAEVDAEAEEEETDPFDLGLPELGEPPPDDEEVVSPPSAPAAAPFASPIQAGGDDLGGDFDLGLNLLDEEEIAVALKESEAREEEEEEFDLGLPDLSTESGEEATSGSPDSRVTPPSVTGTEPARDQDIPLPEASVPETASATEPVTVSGEFEDFDTSLPGEEEDEPAGGIEEDDFEIPDPESLVLEDDLDDEEDTGHGPMDQSIMDSVVDFDLGDEEEDGEEYGPSGKDSVVESTSVLSDDIPTDFDLPDGEGEQLEGKVMTDTPEKDTDATLNGPDIEDLDLDMDLSDDEPRGGEVSEDSGDAASDLDLDLDVDLDLDLDSEESAPAEEEAAREPQTSADLDLDLDLGDTEASAEPSGGAEEDMDFDLGDIEADAEPDAEDTDMDFDLGDLDSSDETTVSDEGDFDLGGPGGADETPSAAESDDMDLDFDLEAPSPPSSGGGEMDLDLGEGPEAGESDDLMSAATGGTDGDMGGSPGNILDLDLDELEAETEQYASKEENEDLLDDDLGLPDLNAPTEEDTGGMDLEFEDELAELDESKSEPEAELDLESPGEDMEEDILSEEVEPTDTLELEMDNGVETASPEDETVAVDTGELDLDTGGLDSDDLDMDMEGMGDSPEELAEEGGLDMDFEATMEMEEPVLQEEPPEETRLEDPMRRREEEEPREVEQEIASEEVEMEEEEEETAEEKTPAKGKKEKKAKKAEAGDKVRLGGGTSPLKVVLLLLLLVVAAGLGVFFYMPGILPSFLTGGGQAEEAGVVDPGNMKIELVRVQESFATDRTGSLVFVINGTIRNDYETARKQIRVRGRLFDAQGNPVGTSTAYVGNKLTEQDISNMNPEAIRQQMNSRNGVNNVNDNVAPGQLVPFSLVFFNLPENLAEYAVEVTTSMPAG
ncbi:MAG: DUF3426 domain-containing protein [Desulfatibacillaceae bacterium]